MCSIAKQCYDIAYSANHAKVLGFHPALFCWLNHQVIDPSFLISVTVNRFPNVM